METQLSISEEKSQVLDEALLLVNEADKTLMDLLEQCFLVWGKKMKTVEISFPPIISIKDLETINYFEDHPTQAVFLSAIPSYTNPSEGSYANNAEPLQYALNPAACYHAYISQRDQEIDEMVRISTQTKCFRNQPPYSSTGRMFTFTQRKFVFMGGSQEVRNALKSSEKFVYELGTALGLELGEQPSQAPNYIEDPKLGKVKALFLADKEFMYKSFPALCHTNFHRNYFCKRLNVKLSNGRYAFAGCLGVIPEYWLLSLKDKYGSDMTTITQLLNNYLNINAQ
ncbi:hypothetical protein POV27_09520 [Aureisphaera galaxeae]|uniref:hypothetical protein n=1 Tax=Aureisphaera galaxeae TaxID=1538023 RepID=UPI00234FC4EF|nr:hypothetical protein [Aureisphaera galaxeae]MDC8004289.1 hypothetical protein [Aureisphaera galaxeae]